MMQFTTHCKMPGLTCCKYRIQTRIPADNVMRVEVWCTEFRYDYDNIIALPICKCEENKEG
jgi:hypothetical protein